MSFYFHRFLFVFAVLISILAEAEEVQMDSIAFGSCVKQDKAIPIFASISRLQPDLFIFMGDNIYADTQDRDVMHNKYRQLGDKPEYQYLRSQIKVLATWDDHDFGSNDIGAENPIKELSKKQFLEFFKVAHNTPVWNRPGIYQAKKYTWQRRSVQIILLDTRTFRGPLVRGPATPECANGRYLPQTDRNVTLLGEDQWAWFENQLWQPADLRIIVSSIQIIPEQHCYEKWSNIPHEKQRLFRILQRSQANGVILISGDRHIGEISRTDDGRIGYPLYEVTSSSLNANWPKQTEANRYRVAADNIRANNFGLISIDWAQSDPAISLQLRGKEGEILQQTAFPLSQLSFH